MSLEFEPLDVDTATTDLLADMYNSSESTHRYILKHKEIYTRLRATNMLGYVATVYGQGHGESEAENRFNDGAILGLRAVIISRAALIGLRLTLSDVDPLAELSISDDKSIDAQNRVIASRIKDGLEYDVLHKPPYEYWAQVMGNRNSTNHVKSGFVFTIESARIAADQRSYYAIEAALAQ